MRGRAAGAMLRGMEARDAGTAETIEAGIRDLVARRRAAGALVGLSGGLDSAVLAALAARALGSARVRAVFLGERDSEADSLARAREVAARLGLALEVRSLEADLRAQGLYASAPMRFVARSARANRAVTHLMRWLGGGSPYAWVLRQRAGEGRGIGRAAYERWIRPVEEASYARHRLRRAILDAEAKAQNLVLLGAANRSELLLGWYVTGGIDDVPDSPILGLTKTRVRRLAADLGIPRSIREAAPSPDMIPGVTDELAMGVSYARADRVLDAMDAGLDAEAMVRRSLPRRDVARVGELRRLAAWKREAAS
ncbi:MAG: NAD(+) synthase [Candidatus Krumholzibacteriota bacterium]|nr:NAD(+) synthase [Candidatus Krumholzibacteriota bacterium]